MDYGNPKENRDGSDKDEERLRKVFKRLKFKLGKPEKNTRGSDMDSILKKYAEMDHNDMDCFVCCILSHGQKDEVICCDKDCVSIETITRYFRASDCISLAGKPKLFFFQACQGQKRMGGIHVDGCNVVGGKMTLKPGSVPDEADFLLGFATTSGYVSYRYDNTGSVYIQTLCDLLENHAHEYDLLTIMTILHQNVSEDVFEEDTGDGIKHKQMPATLHRLRKQLCFNI